MYLKINKRGERNQLEFRFLRLWGSLGVSIGWVRLFGYGVKYKSTKKHRLLFSERNRYAKSIQIGNWFFKYLKPSKTKVI